MLGGEAQMEVVGKGDKVRQVLIPAVIPARLFASRGGLPASIKLVLLLRPVRILTGA